MADRRDSRFMARVVLAAGLLLLAPGQGRAEVAQDKLPVLSGRVVDDAHVLKPEDQARLAVKLKDLETRSGTQFVVATVPTLQGEEIEPYANALFRKWRLGQKDKNNGVLFLIAPTERKLRFEVGYGLEGTLTDALTKLILHNAVSPKLKAGDFSGGVDAGVDEAIAVLTTDKASWQKRPALQSTEAQDQPLSAGAVVLLLLGGLVFLVVLYRFRRSINWTSLAVGAAIGSGGGSSSGASGDSFSGGGGDSGGGGSSDSY